jgi:hypothetical protein
LKNGENRPETRKKLKGKRENLAVSGFKRRISGDQGQLRDMMG